MKTAIFLFISIILVLGCSDDDNKEVKPKELYLSKVYQNSLLQYEYLYDADKKPYRRNRYSINQGQSELVEFRIYDYNAAGQLIKSTDFNDEGQNNGSEELTYNASDLLSRLDSYSSSNDLISYFVFEYDNSNLLKTYTVFLGASNKKTVEANFTYSADGKLAKITRKNFVGTSTLKRDSTTYSIAGKLPAHWRYYETQPVIALPIGETFLFDMITESSLYYYFDAPPTFSEKTLSGKEFDDAGYLKKQTINAKNNDGIETTETNNEMTYEYVE